MAHKNCDPRRYWSKKFNFPIKNGVKLYVKVRRYSWVTEYPKYGFMLGGIPTKNYLKKNKHRISGIINLCDESVDDTDIKTLHLPTVDSREPTKKQIRRGVKFFRKLRKNEPNKFVYIHCRVGVSRSAEMCVACLCSEFAKGPGRAFRILQKKRPQIKSKCYTRPNITAFCNEYMKNNMACQ